MAKRQRIIKTPDDGVIVLSYALNLRDPDHYQMYQHICKRTNHSAFVVRLIQRDMDGTVVQRPVETKQDELSFNVEGFI